MPRKEDISLEERIERADFLHQQKQHRKNKIIHQLYGTSIYKAARKSCIVFLWIAQLIVIDWMLPYYPVPDKVVNGNMPEAGIAKKAMAASETFVQLDAQKHRNIKIIVETNVFFPKNGDSLLIYKSYLLREIKKIKDTRQNQTYWVSNTLTYIMLPLILIPSGLSLLFLFVENIEVKAFYYFMLILNTLSSVSLAVFYVFSLLQGI
ncbi:MAG: hypothetical protein JST67_00260 [Bacteroidetes bacterium]|nr:hypothetical protein [Bacteroidota bacterium]